MSARARAKDMRCTMLTPSLAFFPLFARTGSWIDPERGNFWLSGLTLARYHGLKEAEKAREAEHNLLASVWSKWGHKYK